MITFVIICVLFCYALTVWKASFLIGVDSFILKFVIKRSSTLPFISKKPLYAIRKKESLGRKAKTSFLNVMSFNNQKIC